jgi:hypothetical protein
MTHCTDCNRLYFTLDLVGLCDECAYRRVRQAERLAQREPTLTIATLAGWAMTDEPPHRYRAAWRTW